MLGLLCSHSSGYRSAGGRVFRHLTMKLNRPLRFEICSPIRLIPLRFSIASTLISQSNIPAVPDSSVEFNQRMGRYKRAGFEWSQIWRQNIQRDIYNYKSPMIVHLLIDPFESADWRVEDWHIKFMLSERLLTHARKQSNQRDWYEDSHIIGTWNKLMITCFHSVQRYHRTFHNLPTIGDRLFNEDTGWMIQDRSIDGDQMTITFTLDS